MSSLTTELNNYCHGWDCSGVSGSRRSSGVSIIYCQNNNDNNKSRTYCNVSVISRNAMKPNSAYVPRNRLSRYLTAFSSLALVKFKSVLGSELPLDKIGLFANTSFCWLGEYLKAGYKNGLKDKILPSLSQRETCNVNGPRLDSLLQTHFVCRGQSGASISRVLWNFVRTRVLVTFFIYFIGTSLSLVIPMFIIQEILKSPKYDKPLPENTTIIPLTAWIMGDNLSSNNNRSVVSLNNSSNGTLEENDELLAENEITILTWTVLIIVVQVISQFLIAWSMSLSLRTAVRARSGCLSVAYRRLLASSLKNSSRVQQSLTYFVPESETLQELVSQGPLVLVGPMVLVLVTGYAWIYVGHWHAVGILLVVSVYIGTMITAHLFSGFANRAIDFSLRRMAFLEEFLSNIHIAKITQWDRHFQDRIEDVRRQELVQMQFGGFIEGCGLCLVHMIPIFSISFVTLIGLNFGGKISFKEYVPIMLLFLINLKECIRTSWMALGSISRGKAFLDKLKSVLILEETTRFIDKPIDKSFAIVINNGHFAWSKEKLQTAKNSKRSSRFYVESYNGSYVQFDFPIFTHSTLQEIDFCLSKGQLVGVCGSQNSGKSSLILSILGHLDCVGGSISMDGNFSYVSEDAWLMDATIKENILFGQSYDSNRYYRTIRSTHLNIEMSSLPEFDDTEVAVANFESAQRQKLVLARAIYAQRDIYLLDNPLSELSNQDCLNIFEKSVVQFLANKSVVVVTNRPELLEKCQLVYVMQEGRIVESGSPVELVQRGGYYKSLRSLAFRKWGQKILKSRDIPSPSPTKLTPSSPRDIFSSITTFSTIDNNNEEDCTSPLEWGNFEFPILQNFSRGKMKTGPAVYFKYSGGRSVCILVCVLAGFYSLSIALTPVVVFEVGKHDDKDFTWACGVMVTVVGLAIVCGVILTIAYNKTVFVVATRMYDYWIENLTTMQVSIFNSSTIPLLLNICCLNLQEVDYVLPKSLITILLHVGISLFSIIILWYLSPWFFVPIAAFLILSMIISIYIRRPILCFHELKMCSSILVLNHISNTVQGRATIQALGREKDFLKSFYKMLNEELTYNFMLHATKLWLEFRIKLLSVVVLGAVILMCEKVPTDNHVVSLTLVLICTLQTTISVFYISGMMGSVWCSLMALNSVERYIKIIPKEREGTARLSDSWPSEGSVRFKHVYLQHLPHKSLNFIVSPGEKIDIILPQSASKLSFVSSLFRLSDVPENQVFICNTDVTTVALDKLRRCVCFVPANPVLFSGTLRGNLDPTSRLSDQCIMSALQRVYLWEKVARLPDKLLSDVLHLFTVSERILIFLARAILHKRIKIIVIEEPDKDLLDKSELIELVLRDIFTDYTIIRLISNPSQKTRTSHRVLFLEDEMMRNNNSNVHPDRSSLITSDLTLSEFNSNDSKSDHIDSCNDTLTLLPLKNLRFKNEIKKNSETV